MATFHVDNAGSLRVETYRSGPMVFQIGLDLEALEHFRVLAEHAYARFASMPRIPALTEDFEHFVMVSAIHSTDTIEGGDLTAEQTSSVLEADPATAQKEAEKRIVNLRTAYRLAEDHVAGLSDTQGRQAPAGQKEGSAFELEEMIIRDLHGAITANLSHKDNVPGQYRNNPKNRMTKVGSPEHGGIYTPPKCLDDIKLLMEAFITWANSGPIISLHPFYRAPLIHYFFERIHPFWDGNGRVGRVLEAIVLQAAGFRYVPYALCRYYLDNIHAYFTLFNTCRLSEKKQSGPNTGFVRFHLAAAINTINCLQDRANQAVAAFLFDSHIHFLSTQKKGLNHRQCVILDWLLRDPDLGVNGKMGSQPWYNAIYRKLTARTKMRDIKKLEYLGLIRRDKNGAIRIAYARPQIELASSPLTTVSF